MGNSNSHSLSHLQCSVCLRVMSRVNMVGILPGQMPICQECLARQQENNHDSTNRPSTTFSSFAVSLAGISDNSASHQTDAMPRRQLVAGSPRQSAPYGQFSERRRRHIVLSDTGTKKVHDDLERNMDASCVLF